MITSAVLYFFVLDLDLAFFVNTKLAGLAGKILQPPPQAVESCRQPFFYSGLNRLFAKISNLDAISTQHIASLYCSLCDIITFAQACS